MRVRRVQEQRAPPNRVSFGEVPEVGVKSVLPARVCVRGLHALSPSLFLSLSLSLVVPQDAPERAPRRREGGSRPGNARRQHEGERQAAIATILHKKPDAFDTYTESPSLCLAFSKDARYRRDARESAQRVGHAFLCAPRVGSSSHRRESARALEMSTHFFLRGATFFFA